MGALWDEIERYRDRQQWRPSNRRMASAIGISPTAFGNWQSISEPPKPEHLHSLSRLIGVPYEQLLHAALVDAGYREERGGDGRDAAPNTHAGGSPDDPPDAAQDPSPPSDEVRAQLDAVTDELAKKIDDAPKTPAKGNVKGARGARSHPRI